MTKIKHSSLVLPHSRKAIAYLYQDQSQEQSSIEVIGNNKQVLYTLTIPDTIKKMRLIARTGLLAVATKENASISFYNLGESKPDKPEKVLTFDSPVQDLVATDEHLIVAAGGHLHILDNHHFIPLKAIGAGKLIHSIAVKNQFLFCDVLNIHDFPSRVSVQLLMYDYQKGQLLRRIGESLDKPKFVNLFMGLLTGDHVFIGLKKNSACELFIYQCTSGTLIKTVIIPTSGLIFICSLPSGQIAVYREQKPQHVEVCHGLESETPQWTTFNGFSGELNQDNIVSFIAGHDKRLLQKPATELAGLLTQFSLFPTPINQLVTAYSLKTTALENEELESFVRTLYK